MRRWRPRTRCSGCAVLPARPPGRVVVVGAGKASAAMAQAVEQAWDGPLSGLVVTRYGHAVPCARIEIVQAAHPVPDAAGDGGRAPDRSELVSGLAADDLVHRADLRRRLGAAGGARAGDDTGRQASGQRRAAALSGASISEMNCVRRHLSAIKGGRLGAAVPFPARVVTLLISDVPGDDPAVTSPPARPWRDPTTLRARAGHRCGRQHRRAGRGAGALESAGLRIGQAGRPATGPQRPIA